MAGKQFLKILLILVAAAILFSLVYVFIVKKHFDFGDNLADSDPALVGKEAKPFQAVLLEKNKDFAYAEGLANQGKTEEAIEAYNRALLSAKSAKEESQIKYRLAMALADSDRPNEAIALLKEIVANSNFSDEIRAYAVQQLGNIIYTYNSQEVENEVFKDDPYKGFFSSGDYSLARRNLYEYASSLKTLGVPELRIAKWYSGEVLRISKDSVSAENQKTIDGYMVLIQEKLRNADNYVKNVEGDEFVKNYIPEVLYRKANVLADLSLAGNETLGNPETAYQEALDFSTLKMNPEASAKLAYAVFLAKKDSQGRSEDIKELLADFSNGRYAKTSSVRSLREEGNDRLGNKENYLLLSQIDPRFRDYLITLGWKF